MPLFGAENGATAWSQAWAAWKLLAQLPLSVNAAVNVSGVRLQEGTQMFRLSLAVTLASMGMTFIGLLVEGTPIVYRQAIHPSPVIPIHKLISDPNSSEIPRST